MRHPTSVFRIAFFLIWVGLALPLLAVFDHPPASVPDHRALAGSAWLAALYWYIGLILLLADLGMESPDPAARGWWTAGCAFAVLHTAIAFHVVDGWSHAAAFEHTERVSGFGAGVFVNYLFLAIWWIDVLWLWVAPRLYGRRPQWLTWTLYGFLTFVMLNATVVFASGPLRWVAAAAFAWLAVAAVAGRRSSNARFR